MKKNYLPILISAISLLTFRVCFSQINDDNSKLTLNDTLIINTRDITIDSLSDNNRHCSTQGFILKKEQIQDSPEVDINRVISNKVSGLEVMATNGLTGSANRIWIRGISSLYGDNNAMFVIDGIPMTNTTTQFDHWVEHLMSPTRSLDINPNNIDKIEVLKGLAATNLYGTEGRNGVILITTKTGGSDSISNLLSNPQIQFTSSNHYIDIANLPDYQNKFGQGYDQRYGSWNINWGPGFYRDGLGGWGIDPSFDENGTVPHPYSDSYYLADNFPELYAYYEGERYEWKPRNSVSEFFETGSSLNAAFNFLTKSKNNKNIFGFDIDYLKETGFTPNNDLKRCAVSFGNSSDILKNLRLNSSVHYVRTDTSTPQNYLNAFTAIPEFYTPFYENIFTTPRGIDFYDLPYEAPDGNNLYYNNLLQHPLWTLNNAGYSQLNNRFFGKISLNYNLSDRIGITYDINLDTFLEDNTHYLNRGGSSYGNSYYSSGLYETYDSDSKMIMNNLRFNYYLDEEKFNYEFLFGLDSKTATYSQIGKRSKYQEIYGYLSHSNFLQQETIDKTNERNIYGLFGRVSVNFQDFLFLDISGRNDFDSDENSNSVFMPALSLSFVPTQYFTKLKNNRILNHVKLKTAYGTSANYDTTYLSRTLINSALDDYENLLPEYMSEIEFGLESMFLNFATIDLTYYSRRLKNLVVPHTERINFEYFTTIQNSGIVKLSGFEADVQLNLFDNQKGFSWFSKVNFTRNNSEVIDTGEADVILYSNRHLNGAREAYPLGAFFGHSIIRNEDGVPLVYSGGFYGLTNVDDEGLRPYIGDPNPDFIINYANMISYKKLSLRFLINHRIGGDIDTFTVPSLLGRGLTTDTSDRLGTYILPGVSAETGEENTVQITNSNFYYHNINGFSPFTELSIYDASVVRLQEISLGYEFVNEYLKKAFIKKISIQLTGYNLWFNAYNMPEGTNYDPAFSSATYGNSKGFESFSGPSSKRVGLKLNFVF